MDNNNITVNLTIDGNRAQEMTIQGDIKSWSAKKLKEWIFSHRHLKFVSKSTEDTLLVAVTHAGVDFEELVPIEGPNPLELYWEDLANCDELRLIQTRPQGKGRKY